MTEEHSFPKRSAGSSITINRRVGSYLEDEIATRDYNIDFIGRGEFSLTDNIDLTAIIGWSLNDRKYNRSSGSISDFLVNATKRTTALNSSQESSTFENAKSFTRSNRGYAVLNFGINDELFVNVTGAVEASSTIKGSFFYPAADVAGILQIVHSIKYYFVWKIESFVWYCGSATSTSQV